MFDLDRIRIEEERAGIARPAPRSLASSHLLQALNALDDACSPEALYRSRRTWPLRREERSASAWRTLADINQRDHCCTATLYTAFAAEALVNDFLDVHLRDKVEASKFKKIDRWPTRRKYVEAVALAYAPLFQDGEDES